MRPRLEARLSPRPRVVLGLMVCLYVALGAQYATLTPAWETPDEPAHFNYVRFVAEHGAALPVLGAGDYNQDYMERLKAAHFPSSLSIEPVRYEFHQPPLYYGLAAPIYLLARPLGSVGALLSLRFLSLAFGVGVLLFGYAGLRELWPDEPVTVLAAVGLAASVPMHVALTAGVNNDTLAELILGALLLVCLRRLFGKESDRGFVALGGILLGLALLTKTTIYLSCLLLPLYAEWGRRARVPLAGKVSPMQLARTLWPLYGVGALLSGAWFARNLLTYGWNDPMGLARHDAVVVGQPTTAEWVARFGLKNIAADFIIITFKSFWAQFGWMGVLVNDRIYVGLFVLTVAALFGLALWLTRFFRERDNLLRTQVWGLGMLALVFAFTLAGDVIYNLKLVQPQGRYLFPALFPIAAFLVIGLRELIAREHHRAVFLLLYLGLLGLDMYSLYGFIVPQLGN